MIGLHDFLANTWFLLLGIVLALYVVLDGLDLGVGILTLFHRDDPFRTAAMNSLGSVWDANETWLILLGGALFGAFPLAYGVVLHALPIPLLFMLLALVVRAVAFARRNRPRPAIPWARVFAGSSLLAALAQGFALGALIEGLTVRHGLYTGGVWDWLTPFSTLVALGLSAGYALLGATYLVMKTDGALRRRCAQRALGAGWLTMAAAGTVTLWTAYLPGPIAHKWAQSATADYLLLAPVIALLAFAMLLRALRREREHAPFVWSLAIFAVSLAGLAVGLYPYVLPQNLTVYQAAASSQTLVFLLTGIGILIPLLLIYSGYQYPVFRVQGQRVDEDARTGTGTGTLHGDDAQWRR